MARKNNPHGFFRRSPRAVRCILAVAAVFLLSTGLTAAARFVQEEVRPLDPGQPVEREMAGGAAHAYRLDLTAGQFLHVVAEQRGIDVILTLLDPNGKKLEEANRARGPQGAEEVVLVTQAAGSYRLEVRPVNQDAVAGRYEVKIHELRHATDAQRVFYEAERLRQQGTDESRRQAAVKYQEALRLSQEAGDARGQLAALNGLGTVYRQLNERRQALEFYEQAARLGREAGDGEAQAQALTQIARLHETAQEKEQAVAAYNRLLQLWREQENRRGEADTLLALGELHRNQGENQQALEYYNLCLPIYREVGYLTGEATTFNNMALVYRVWGEMQQALDAYNMTLELDRKAGTPKAMVAQTINNLGQVYFWLGDPRKALEYYNQALPDFEAAGDRRRVAFALNNIGQAYDHLGEREKALDYFTRSLAIRREINDRQNQTTSLGNLADLSRKMGDYQKALEFSRQGIELSRAENMRTIEALTWIVLGKTYEALNRLPEAEDAFRQALAITPITGDRNAEADALYGLARVERARGNLTAARERIEENLKIVESVRRKVVSQELRTSYQAFAQNFYGFYVDLLMQLYQSRRDPQFAAAALQVSERARARSLVELLNEAQANIHEGVDPALLERERSLRRAISEKETQQLRAAKEKAAAIKEELAALTDQYRRLQAQIRINSPRYAALTQPEPLTVQEIQQQTLDRDTLLLEYWLGEKRSFLWVVSHDALASYELPPRATIEAAARAVYDMLTARNQARRDETLAQKRRRVRRADADFPPAAARLSRVLLGGVAPQLRGKRLLVVADGALQYIPFAALPDPNAGGAYQPLAAGHEVVSLPSASTLAVLRREVQGREPAPRTLAVIADPVFDSSDQRVKLAAGKAPEKTAEQLIAEARLLKQVDGDADEAPRILRPARLQYTRTEAERLTALVGAGETMLALDFDASLKAVTSRNLSQYRYVHFASHGYLRSDQPELSAILLSMVDERGAPQFGFLRALDVYNLHLPAELVVLSACQTGLGKEIKGEGLVGLTRGFMYAGAARVVVSLWSVNDRATADLMTIFYEKMLKRGLSPAAALRAAQVEMWKKREWPSPYYWAAFVLQGEWK
ncbi:MAG TPA: CHAT domain-containing protein [Blastocatellia bacterium]|nr:CHAT domain-containing protein [Blastocatellia bacterium]